MNVAERAMNPFAAYLAQAAALVEAELDAIFVEEKARLDAQTPELASLFEQVRALTSRGGKRLRAALVLLGYRAFGGEGERAALPAASAMEFLQSYFLIHDDWIDDDPVRRGGPSVHIALRERYASARLGDAGAVLAGDYAVSLAQQSLLRCSGAQVAAAARAFADLQRDVVLGQCLDVLVNDAVPFSALMQRTHLLKTAAYTTTGPLLVGATLAGASDTQCAALRAFADPAGVAFQLRDDWLGTFGDPTRTGKQNDSDLREGKQTAVLATLEHDPAHHDVLRAFLRGGAARERSAEEIASMRALLERADASAQVNAWIAEHVANARAALTRLDLSSELVALLEGMLVMIAERQA